MTFEEKQLVQIGKRIVKIVTDYDQHEPHSDSQKSLYFSRVLDVVRDETELNGMGVAGY